MMTEEVHSELTASSHILFCECCTLSGAPYSTANQRVVNCLFNLAKHY